MVRWVINILLANHISTPIVRKQDFICVLQMLQGFEDFQLWTMGTARTTHKTDWLTDASAWNHSKLLFKCNQCKVSSIGLKYMVPLFIYCCAFPEVLKAFDKVTAEREAEPELPVILRCRQSKTQLPKCQSNFLHFASFHEAFMCIRHVCHTKH